MELFRGLPTLRRPARRAGFTVSSGSPADGRAPQRDSATPSAGSGSGLPTLRRPARRAGFTLIEVAVALAIFAVILAMGWGSMQRDLPRFRTVRASKGLQADLMTLRNLAISTNRETRLHLQSSGGDCEGDPGSWGGSWTLEAGDRSTRAEAWELLPVDAEDGSDDDQTEGVRDLGDGGNRQAADVCLLDWGSLEGSGSGNEDAIVFSPRGWVSNPGGDFQSNGYIELDLLNQDSNRRGVNDRVTVRISRSGMVRLVSSLGKEDNSTVGTEASSSAP